MAEKLKGGVVIFVILIGVALAMAAGVFYLYYQEHAKNVTIQKELEEVKTEQQITETKLNEARQQVTDLTTKVKDATTKADRFAADLEKEKASRAENLAQIEKLKIDVTQLNNARIDLEKKLAAAEDTAGRAQSQLRELDSRRTALETKVKELEAAAQAKAQQEEGVELGKIVVNPDAAPAGAQASAPPTPTAMPANLEGKVLVVNKEYNFVVLNVGSKDGVSVGDIFTVYRGTKPVTDVRVEKVHESMAAAGYLTKDLKEKISEGDRVVPKK